MMRLGDVYFRTQKDQKSRVKARRKNVSTGEGYSPSSNTLARVVFRLGQIGISIGENVKRASDKFTEILSNIPFGPIGIAQILREADEKNK